MLNQINFDLFNRLSRDYQPEYDINTTIKELIDGLKAIEFRDKDFRKSKLMRLNVINELIEKGIIDSNLKFRK
jgi:hypothetical protein